MPKKSAGLLLFRRNSQGSQVEVFLVHPGGPFWRKKDEGAWTIPKGEFIDDEDALAAARREFRKRPEVSHRLANTCAQTG
jgi:predicted NUDIX family NTP pyrophosphohydrolase